MMYRKSHCVVIRTHHVLKPFFSPFPTWCQVVPLSLPSVLTLDIFSSFLKTPYMECLEYHLETRLTRIFLFFFLSFTNLMRVWWGIHLGRRPKLGPGGSSRISLLSSLCVPAQLCLTLCDPRDCSPSDSSVHGIFQARTLEWVAISSSREPSRLRD